MQWIWSGWRWRRGPRTSARDGFCWVRFLHPTSERQWELLRDAARTEAAAVRTLRLMENERADAILAEAASSFLQGDTETRIRRAIEYRRAWKLPLAGPNLESLVFRMGAALGPELRLFTHAIHVSEDRRKALARILLDSEEDRFDCEVTLHEDLGEWRVRGVHEATHNFLPPRAPFKPRRPAFEFEMPPKLVP